MDILTRLAGSWLGLRALAARAAEIEHRLNTVDRQIETKLADKIYAHFDANMRTEVKRVLETEMDEPWFREEIRSVIADLIKDGLSVKVVHDR